MLFFFLINSSFLLIDRSYTSARNGAHSRAVLFSMRAPVDAQQSVVRHRHTKQRKMVVL